MSMRTAKGGILGAAAILLAAGSLAGAATYYVDGPGGDGLADGGKDANGGTLEAPWLTIEHGVQQLKPGDTLEIRGGEYTDVIRNTIPSGTPAARVTVENYRDEVVTIGPAEEVRTDNLVLICGDKSYITVKGLVLDGKRRVRDEMVQIDCDRAGAWPHHLRLEGVTVKEGGSRGIRLVVNDSEFINLKIIHNGRNREEDHGLMLAGCRNLIEGCEIARNCAYGLHLYGGSKPIDNNVVRSNYVHDNRKGAILATGTRNVGNAAYNNVFVDNSVTIRGTATKFYNNTVVGKGAPVSVNGTASAEIRNNILAGGSRVRGLNDSRGGKPINQDAVVADNLSTADAMFVDQGAGDFRLKAGSPAIDAGIALAEVTVDKDGIPRPQGGAADLGAYEFTSAK
ncbi:MAG: right-handed parallel beta-helix repeat-containing protein [Kiritimatiellae bacterium]|nr:right-handed parallel beta-helix repeat-containing protein [Kiritimatiellia bacterium]